MMCSQRAANVQPSSLPSPASKGESCLMQAASARGLLCFQSAGLLFLFSSFKTPRLCADYSPALGHIAHAVLLEENSGRGALAR